jgi:hypothetical protein
MRFKTVAARFLRCTARYKTPEWLAKHEEMLEQKRLPTGLYVALRPKAKSRSSPSVLPPTFRTIAVGLGEQPICATQKIIFLNLFGVFLTKITRASSGGAVLRSKVSVPATYTCTERRGRWQLIACCCGVRRGCTGDDARRLPPGAVSTRARQSWATASPKEKTTRKLRKGNGVPKSRSTKKDVPMETFR